MSKTNNIFTINNNKEKLQSFFCKYAPKNHIVMSVIISHTPDVIKNMILSYMKNKAELYKNIYFLIYYIDGNNIDLLPKFPTKINDYPYIIYIYNGEDKLLDASSVTTFKVLKESFNVVEDYYKDTNDNEQKTESNSNNIQSSDNSNNNNNSNSNNNTSNKKSNKKNLPKPVNPDGIEPLNTEPEIDYLEENKKMADKILLFLEFKKDYENVFLKDIGRRKKLEKKLKDDSREDQSKKKNNNNSSGKKK